MVAITCSECSTEIGEPRNYCPECGNELEYEICPRCESPLPDGAESCVDCGHELVVRGDDATAAGPFRGPETDDVVEAVQQTEDEVQEIVLELLQLDPDLFRAYAYLLDLAEPPYEIPADAPEYQQQLFDLVEGSGLKKSVDRLTREFNEDVDSGPDAPEEASEAWVKAQLEELVGYGVLGRYDARSGPEYGSVTQILSDTLSASDNSLEDIDDCVAETGLPRELVLYRVLDASMSYLDFSGYREIEAGTAAADD